GDAPLCTATFYDATLTKRHGDWRAPVRLDEESDTATATLSSEAAVELFHLLDGAPQSIDDGRVLRKQLRLSLDTGAELMQELDLYLVKTSQRAPAEAKWSASEIGRAHV